MNAHMKSPTLYEANQTVCDDLAKRGYTAIAEMAKHFNDAAQMSDALGFTHSTVAHWLDGRNGIAWTSNKKAAAWLEAQKGPPRGFTATPAPDPTAMLMVVCDRAKLEKVQKILAMIGCEVVEI